MLDATCDRSQTRAASEKMWCTILFRVFLPVGASRLTTVAYLMMQISIRFRYISEQYFVCPAESR